MNVLAEAVNAPGINQALDLIQKALGIKDGGCADWVISHEHRSQWQSLSRDERCACLSNYLKVETYYGTGGGSDVVL